MEVGEIPKNVRYAARVVLIDCTNRVLLLQAREPASDRSFWVMPGGGLEIGERFEDTARREVFEETGIIISIGPCVWVRRHKHTWNGNPADQYEIFFVSRLDTEETVLTGQKPDSYIIGHRWWSLSDIMASSEDFAPRRLAELLEPLLRGDYPVVPIDCGV